MQLPFSLRRGQWKPGGIPRINPFHPLAQGLLFYGFDTGSGIVDLTGFSRPAASVGTAPGRSISPYGSGILWNNSGGQPFPSSAAIRAKGSAGGYSFACSYIQTGTVGAYTDVFCRSAENNASSPYLNWAFTINAGGLGQNSVECSINASNSPTNIATWNGNANNVLTTLAGTVASGGLGSYYANGAPVGTSSGLSPTNDNTGDDIVFSGISSAGSVNPFVGFIPWGGFWGRVLSAAEALQLHLDPYCFLTFPEDELAALLAGAAGHLVTNDYYLPVEWLLATRRDETAATEFRGTLRNDAGVACEWLALASEGAGARLEISGKLSRDGAVPLEFAASLAPDGKAAIEFIGAVRGDRAVPLEWTGALGVVADGVLPFAWGGALRSDGSVPFAFAAALSVDDGAPAEILVAVRRAGAQPFAFDLAVCGDPATPLEWYAPAIVLHATLLALAPHRRRIATPLPRHLTITFRPNTMSQTQDLSPPIDAVVEQEIVGFDFGPVLAAGAAIAVVVGVTCAVYRGADSNPSARLLGAATTAPSQATGAPNAQVNQLVGTMLAGATYRLQCTVATSDGQTLDLWTHLACVAVI